MDASTHSDSIQRDSKMATRRLQRSVIILVVVIVAGTLGFVLLGDDRSIFDAITLTLVIITTVGMKLHAITLSPEEEVWAIILMVAGITTALYAASTLVAFLVDGELRNALWRRRLQHRIDKLSDHFIVCGFGRMGRALCEALAAKGVPFVLIEHNTDRIAEAESLGYLFVQGNAMDEHRITAAGIERARALSSCLRSDADNVFVTLTARGLNEKLSIIARSENAAAEEKLRRAGANRVICPPVIGASRVAQMMIQPAVDDLIELAVAGEDLEVSKLRVDQFAGLTGRSLADLALPKNTGLIVVAAVHADGNRSFNPPPSFAPDAGDELIVIGPQGGVEKLVAHLQSLASGSAAPA